MNERNPRNIMVEPYASIAGVPVGTDVQEVREQSNRQRRLLEAVADLPQPWVSTRPGRSEGETLSRHLLALRQRLNWLVEVEERFGDDQRGMHQNRAERNALIYALSEFAERAGIEAARPIVADQSRRDRYSPDWVASCDAAFEDAIATGFTTTREGEPGVLYHYLLDDAAPLRVPVAVWFAMRGYARGEAEFDRNPD